MILNGFQEDAWTEWLDAKECLKPTNDLAYEIADAVVTTDPNIIMLCLSENPQLAHEKPPDGICVDSIPVDIIRANLVSTVAVYLLEREKQIELSSEDY